MKNKINEFKNIDSELDTLLNNFKKETALLSDYVKIVNNRYFIEIVNYGDIMISPLINRLMVSKSLFIIMMIKHILKDRLNINMMDNSVNELYNMVIKWWNLNKNEFK